MPELSDNIVHEEADARTLRSQRIAFQQDRAYRVVTLDMGELFPGLPRHIARLLYVYGFDDMEAVKRAPNEAILSIKKISWGTLRLIRNAAPPTETSVPADPHVRVPWGWLISVRARKYVARLLFATDSEANYIDLALKTRVLGLYEALDGEIHLVASTSFGLILATGLLEGTDPDSVEMRARNYFLVPWNQVNSLRLRDTNQEAAP